MVEERKLKLISDIAEMITRGSSLDEVFNFIYDHLQAFLPYNRIAVAMKTERGDRLQIVAVRTDGKVVLTKGYAGSLAGSSLADLLKDGRSRILNDLQGYLAAKPQSDSTRLIVREGMRSSLTLPLKAEGRSVGVMFFSSREPGTYLPEHEEFLRGLVGQMALAIERARLSDELREKSEYLENILHNSVEAVVVIGRDDAIQSWNEGARRIFGWTEEEILGKSFGILVPPELLQSGELERTRLAVERDGFVRDYETTRLTKDGRPLVVSFTSTVLKDKRGLIIGRSAMIRDVTHLKRLQEDLVKTQSLAAVGELAATVAHEVKNPLAGISGAIQVLADGFPPADPRREVVKEILEQINRLDRTVRDLLAFARPSTPQRQDVRLGESLLRAWTLLEKQPGAAGIRFAMEGVDGIRLQADPHLLQQVWINLFQNAVEAMPQGGDLVVRLEDGERAVVEIRDTGHGVEAGAAAKLFRPFFSTKTRGTGLGLAITRKIVEAHGGAIRVASEPRRGTSVFVEIPR